MRVRLFSIPQYGAGTGNSGATLYISYVFAGGGDLGVREAAYDSTGTTPETAFAHNVMGWPRQDEIFTVEGAGGSQLQSGDMICLRSSDGHYIGIDHDEEDREDYLVATATASDVGSFFQVKVVGDQGYLAADGYLNQLSSLANLDPCSPSYAVTLLGRTDTYVSFWDYGASIDIGAVAVRTQQQVFAVDYLPEPSPHRVAPRRVKAKSPS